MVRPTRQRGGSRVVTKRGSGCGGRGRRRREGNRRAGFLVSDVHRAERRRRRVRQNRVVLAAVAAVKLGGDASTQPGFGASSIRQAMVTRRIRRQGERGISRQPTRAGKAGMSRLPCVSPCIACAMFSTGPTGASRRPAFPAPSFSGEGVKTSKARAKRAARMWTHARCLRFELDVTTIVIASAAKQSRLSPRKDSGLLRCARNDDVERASRHNFGRQARP
jgi:hypothetical protein